MLTVNLAIGMFTPPFGLNLFVSASLFKADIAGLTRGLVPFFVVYLVGLLLVTYWPTPRRSPDWCRERTGRRLGWRCQRAKP